MIWQVIYSAKAKQDLRDITEYLSYVLMMPETARRLASHIMKEIEGLDYMPTKFQIFPHEPWASQGIRRLPVKNYNVFYEIQEDSHVVSIVRIMYAGRDAEAQFDESF
ncbi:MAG: type II toxin-antitoxin system RelE/ParE family toxin [Phascolarctobacterium sp.]